MAPQEPSSHRVKSLFQDVLECYDQKQLSKGRKVADRILKIHPNHADTLCMKGLFLVHLGDREAGKELVRQGVEQGGKSHICWHVLALVQRGEHMYEKSLESYTKALCYDKVNFNLLRDTSTLQTHLRAYDALVESRLQMLQLRPDFRGQWIALAVAFRLSGHLAEARSVLEHFLGFLREVPTHDPDFTELLVFHAGILEELGDLEGALAFLDTQGKFIVDRIAVPTFRARILSKLKVTDAKQVADWGALAESEWRTLLNMNPDCLEYYRGFLANRGVDLDSSAEETHENALEILVDLADQYPKAHCPRRLALTISRGDKFKDLIASYVKVAIKRGIPSLFSDLKGLYTDPLKSQAIWTVIEEIRVASAPDRASSSTDPTEYLWTLYFLAQHYSFLGQHQKGIEMLDHAMAHTPTLPELYMMKAKILKRTGDPYGAVRAMDAARKLDGQDRFINTKCGKYRLRAGMVNEAEEVFGLFIKGTRTPGAELLEMQALHYVVEAADAYRQQGKINLALKKYYAIQNVFETFRSDQFDFHQYIIRKSVLRPYLDMLKWANEVYSHSTYVHAAVSAAQIWVELYDDPSLGKSLQPTAVASTVSSKKALSKAKKAAHKEKARDPQDAANKNSAQASEDKGLDAPPPKDEDPEGIQLVLADDPLERAAKFLSTLKDLCKKNIEVCCAQFDVALRRKKYLQAARALLCARAANAQHPEVHLRIVHFAKAVPSPLESTSSAIGSVLRKTLSNLIPEGIGLEAFNSQYLQLHSTSASATFACARASQLLGAPSEEVESLLFTTLTPDTELSVKDALSILSYLRRIQAPRAERFRMACDEKFELSTVFKNTDEQEALRQQCVSEHEDVGLHVETL